MATVNRNAFLSRIFNDPKHYPYGFARSGDFSISESQALSHFGTLFQALASGQLAPTTDLDLEFLKVISGAQAPQTIAEKAWIKYQTRISRQRLGSIYGYKKSAISEKEDEDDCTDVELDDEEASIELND